jgi:hypothetical protein
MLRTLAVCALLLVSVLAFAGGAWAQIAADDPAAAQYQSDGTGTASASADEGSRSADGLESRIGGLPFTGIDLIVLAGTALVLTGTGFALHRLSAPRV